MPVNGAAVSKQIMSLKRGFGQTLWGTGDGFLIDSPGWGLTLVGWLVGRLAGWLAGCLPSIARAWFR